MSFLTLDLNLLRVFDAVMSEQSLTRAAHRLAMTQPAVSNSLRRLRESLDDEMLIRTPHGVKPTARAEELWPAVQAALTGLEVAIAPQRFDIAHAQATFWLAMADSTASLLLPSLLRAIQQEAPGINVRIMSLTTRDPRPLLIQNDISIAIGFFPGVVAQLIGGQGAPSSIRHQRLYSGEYVCIMRKGHPLANSDLTIDDYCGAAHALVSFSGRAHGPADDVLAGMGRERRIVLTVNQFYTLGRVIAESDLLSIVPRHLISSIDMHDLLITKKVPFALPAVHVDMLWRERDTRHPVHQWMHDTLQVAPNVDIRGSRLVNKREGGEHERSIDC